METTKATETSTSSIATKEVDPKVLTTAEEDLEAKSTALEAEKSRLVEERDNYKNAYLKEKRKKTEFIEDDGGSQPLDEEKLRQITREELANSRLAEIAREQDAIIKKALRENKELKLAHLSKATTTPASVGTHNESIPVTSTLITSEQMASFKAKGWTDKDIERYKKNLQKGGGR
jgi:hypothetical protein